MSRTTLIDEAVKVPEKLLDVTFWDSCRQIVKVFYGEPSFDPFLMINCKQLSFKRVNEEYLQPKSLSNPFLISFYEMWKEKLMKPLTVNEYEALLEDVHFLKERLPFIEFSDTKNIAELDRRFSN